MCIVQVSNVYLTKLLYVWYAPYHVPVYFYIDLLDPSAIPLKSKVNEANVAKFFF